MKYISTRNKNNKFTASQAIAAGLASDGGLMTPEKLPSIDMKFLSELMPLPYDKRAARIMALFLEEYDQEELESYTEKAYSKFDNIQVAPIHTTENGSSFLELWHGPTCAFKDLALQMLPYLLTSSLKKIGEERDVCILVATSGDTGKAALEGFRDVDHTRILVFYPNDGVSTIQRLQMVTQQGNNVGVSAVFGNFDDAQTGVKNLFQDESLKEILNQNSLFFSSANSINWGRVLPQIVYYISAYCDLVCEKKIQIGEKINFCVPTGNFGNILSAYIAKEMGLPVNRLICASNQNNVLTDFIQTGRYDKNREFFTTMSPSMDILISSNLERLLFLLTDQNDQYVLDKMNLLKEKGVYSVDEKLLNKIQSVFSAGYCDDQRTAETINHVFNQYHYLIDPHTAVAFAVYEDYVKKTSDSTYSVIVSTASPYKFCKDVLQSLGEVPLSDGPDLFDQLEKATYTAAPLPLSKLKDLKIRFNETVQKENMIQAVLNLLNL